MFHPILLLCKSLFNVLPCKASYDKALHILHSQTNNVIKTRHQLLHDSQSSLAECERAELGEAFYRVHCHTYSN